MRKGGESGGYSLGALNQQQDVVCHLVWPCCHPVFIHGQSSSYVGIHVHMWVVGVDVVHRSGHMVVSCGCGMHHFVGRMHHLWIVCVVWRWGVAGFQWGGCCS